MVEVVKGACGLRSLVFFSRDFTAKNAFSKSASADSTSFLSVIPGSPIAPSSILLKTPLKERHSAEDSSRHPDFLNKDSTVQKVCGLKARISCSRSTIRRRATDWTRPAESPRITFFHKKGESL